MAQISQNIQIRKANDRGHVNLGWLDSHHSFSFGDYYDPKHMGYRHLRVINDDLIEVGGGFGMHPHKDMEILSYVVEGELAHKDSMGNGSVITQGSFQKMSAGTGVTHSEFNPSKTKRTRLIQIWIMPEKKDLKPSYQELESKDLKKTSGLVLVASNEETPGVIRIFQKVKVYKGSLKASDQENYSSQKGSGIWVQMISGQVEINGILIKAGDGASLEGPEVIRISAKEPSEFLLFDFNG